MADIRIICLSYDGEQLDRAMTKILAGLPAGESRDVDVSIGAKIGGAQVRSIWIHGASEKIAPALSRIDVPKTVDVQVRSY